jgi:hypothetical protein
MKWYDKRDMRQLWGFGKTIVGVSMTLGLFVASSAAADRISSPNYIINGNAGGSFGGQLSSTNYKMSAIGGETVVGNGASGSYIIDQQGGSDPAVPSMSLAVQPSGLVAYYPLDENTGTTTADASQYQHNGTLKTTAAWDANGKLGSAIDINGSTVSSLGDGSVNIPDNANLPTGSQMTFEAWVNCDDPNMSNIKTIASQWNPGVSESWKISAGYGRIWVYIQPTLTGGGSNYVPTSDTAFNTAATWRHVVVVYDGSQAQVDRVKIYIDGTRAAIVGSTNTMPASLQDSSAPFSIGSQNGTTNSFPGLIDHVKLFNRALSPSEVTAEYGAQNTGTAAGLSLGTIIAGSTTSLVDAMVRTNVPGYDLSIQQDHDLQNGANSIPAVSGSISSPAAWNESITKGLGFTLTGAPTLDGKWNSGGSYAGIPSSATTFYSGSGHVNGVVDVVNLRLRLDTSIYQTPGNYANSITYTGTMIP